MTIKLGDKNDVHARNKGTVQLNRLSMEAFFVPEFRISLLSVSQLDSYSLTAIFKDGMCSVIDHHSNNHLSATLDQGLYIVPRLASAHTSSTILPQLGSVRESSTTNIWKSELINIWHRQLVHLNYADVKLILDLDKMTKTTRTPWITPGLCQTCVETKQQQYVIRTKSSRCSTPFEIIHSDLCGPMKHSIRGSQFYIIYIDDCTRYTEVYFLITKTADEISAKFQTYQAWVKTRGFQIKHGRTTSVPSSIHHGRTDYHSAVLPELRQGCNNMENTAPSSASLSSTSPISPLEPSRCSSKRFPSLQLVPVDKIMSCAVRRMAFTAEETERRRQAHPPTQRRNAHRLPRTTDAGGPLTRCRFCSYLLKLASCFNPITHTLATLQATTEVWGMDTYVPPYIHVQYEHF